jgi:hypothetical protein
MRIGPNWNLKRNVLYAALLDLMPMRRQAAAGRTLLGFHLRANICLCTNELPDVKPEGA